MNLEIKHIFSPDLAENNLPDDLQNFRVLLSVSIGEKDKIGEELFYFTVASFLGIKSEVKDAEFKFLHGYILLECFDWKTIRRAIEYLINHSRQLQNWKEVVEYWNRYGNYGS